MVSIAAHIVPKIAQNKSGTVLDKILAVLVRSGGLRTSVIRLGDFFKVVVDKFSNKGVQIFGKKFRLL